MVRSFLFVLFVGLSSRAVVAKVTIASLFTDHAVLQRNAPVPIWGQADPGERITLSFAGQSQSCVTDSSGHWMVKLAPLPTARSGTDLVVHGNSVIVLADVVVGDVWLCSGQSNMEFVVRDPERGVFRVNDAEKEIAAATYPLIRQFKVRRHEADAPVEVAAGTWNPCSPSTVAEFTAVGYFFAREIYRRTGIPIGLIDSSWGGTVIEAWLPPKTLASDPGFSQVDERWHKMLADYPRAQKAYEERMEKWKPSYESALKGGPQSLEAFLKAEPHPLPPHGPGDSWTPGGLFNGMINPVRPYALRGFLWYQGEANTARAGEYHALFSALIESWRQCFSQGDLPFYWVQLPNYGGPVGDGWARLRDAQTAALSLPNTAQAVTIDIGEPGNIHPRNKQEVGRRLALIAANRVYGLPCHDSGPTLISTASEGPALRLRFSEAGLSIKSGLASEFEIADGSRHFVPATVTVKGDTIWLTNRQIEHPVAARYAWRNAPVASLFDQDGLPARPFRTDNW